MQSFLFKTKAPANIKRKPVSLIQSFYCPDCTYDSRFENRIQFKSLFLIEVK